MVCNRPEFIKRDDQGRLHSESTMSIRFRDGWGLYHWHGVEVDREIVVEPWKLTAKRALAERNAEKRRVIVERIGMERFIAEAGAKKIHTHEIGELFRIEIADDEPLVAVRVLNSTQDSSGYRKPYFLRVPPSITRADDAVAWSFGFDTAKQYRPIQET
jgi:hypothetical protein